jgi:hypothetical protein
MSRPKGIEEWGELSSFCHLCESPYTDADHSVILQPVNYGRSQVPVLPKITLPVKF